MRYNSIERRTHIAMQCNVYKEKAIDMQAKILHSIRLV